MREERPVGASTLGRGNSSIPPSQILLIIPYHTSYHRLSLYPESSSSSSSLKPNDFIKSPILHPKTSISVSPSPEDTTDKLTMTTIPSRYPTEDPLLSVSAKQPDFSKTPEISPTNNFSASVTDKYLGNNGNSTTSPIPSRYPPLSPISRAADSNSSNEDILSEKVSDKSFSYSSTQSSSLSLTPTPSCRNLPASAFPTSSTSSLSLVHQTIQSNASDHKSVLSAATESKHSLPISPQGSISSINSNSKKQNKVKNAMNSLLRKFRVSNKAKENIGDLRNEIDELRFLNMVCRRNVN
ncbi:hypothetical protein BKA69DRAFT_1099141 [Paraphysoderma sedebokerense]|nr:hypothetical protein BKA69DRAFT_1099141 [Paraphysoderma sedebokerense]